MSDRFKFRLWNAGVKEMTYFDSGKITFEAPYENERLKPILGFYLAEGSELYLGGYGGLMQCTGLKDKNGILIYEGDIVSILGGDNPAKIIFEGCSFCISFENVLIGGEIKTITAPMTKTPSGADDIFTVIGNIYDNPELLVNHVTEK